MSDPPQIVESEVRQWTRWSIRANPVRTGDAKLRDPRGQPGYRTGKPLMRKSANLLGTLAVTGLAALLKSAAVWAKRVAWVQVKFRPMNRLGRPGDRRRHWLGCNSGSGERGAVAMLVALLFGTG